MGIVSAPGRPAPPPLALYVHFPWCVRKCPYCDFNSHAAPATIPEDDYVAALRADLEASIQPLMGRQVHSIYFGGGTPSLLSPAGLDQIISTARALLRLDPEAEITLEANPGTDAVRHFADYVSAGANRLSLGVQSLADGNLQRLGRIHDARAARDAVGAALASFRRVNVDLMTALPGQSPAAAAADARELAALGAEHFSLYRLSLEPGTEFWRQPPVGMLDHDAGADAEDAARCEVERAGYERYEVSAYARHPTGRSRHNLNYWCFGDYLGIGPGAHSKLSGPAGIVRQMRHKAPGRYLAAARRGQFIAREHKLRAVDTAGEFMLNALRLVEGFPEHLFVERTGLVLGVVGRALATGIQRGLLVRAAGRIRASARGLDLLNELVALFLPPPVKGTGPTPLQAVNRIAAGLPRRPSLR